MNRRSMDLVIEEKKKEVSGAGFSVGNVNSPSMTGDHKYENIIFKMCDGKIDWSFVPFRQFLIYYRIIGF